MNAPQTKIIRRKMNSMAEYPRDLEPPKPRETVREAKLAVSDQVAGSQTVHYNWKWVEAGADFPSEPWMRTVRKFYPKAQGGPLLVDEPQLDQDVAKCERKAKALVARGYRYLIIKPNMDLLECMRALDELDNGQSGASANASR